jgi:hypothetical protein
VIIAAQLHLFAFSLISIPAYSVGGPTLFLSSLQFLQLHSGPEKIFGIGKINKVLYTLWYDYSMVACVNLATGWNKISSK